MIDREKVIKGLETCYYPPAKCEDCPYHDIENCNDALCSDALSLLKEQEAKKPIHNYKKYGDYLDHCPSCEKVLPNVSQYGFAKFCHRCGQAVKWK